jgi:hypothetical protein
LQRIFHTETSVQTHRLNGCFSSLAPLSWIRNQEISGDKTPNISLTPKLYLKKVIKKNRPR